MTHTKYLALVVGSGLSQFAFSAPVTFDFITNHNTSTITQSVQKSTNRLTPFFHAGITSYSQEQMVATNIGSATNSCNAINHNYQCNYSTVSINDSIHLDLGKLVSLASSTLTTLRQNGTDFNLFNSNHITSTDENNNASLPIHHRIWSSVFDSDASVGSHFSFFSFDDIDKYWISDMTIEYIEGTPEPIALGLLGMGLVSFGRMKLKKNT